MLSTVFCHTHRHTLNICKCNVFACVLVRCCCITRLLHDLFAHMLKEFIMSISSNDVTLIHRSKIDYYLTKTNTTNRVPKCMFQFILYVCVPRLTKFICKLIYIPDSQEPQSGYSTQSQESAKWNQTCIGHHYVGGDWTITIQYVYSGVYPCGVEIVWNIKHIFALLSFTSGMEQVRSFFVEDKGPVILQSHYNWCYLPSDTRSQHITAMVMTTRNPCYHNFCLFGLISNWLCPYPLRLLSLITLKYKTK